MNLPVLFRRSALAVRFTSVPGAELYRAAYFVSYDVKVKAQFLLGAGKVDPRSLRYQGLSVGMIGNVCIPLNSFCVREKRKNFDATIEKDALFEVKRRRPLT